MSNYTETISLTFSSSVENHRGMEIIGNQNARGLTVEECIELNKRYPEFSEIIRLNDLLPSFIDEDVKSKIEDAVVLIFRNGVEHVLGLDASELYKEQAKLNYDSKMYAYGKVMEKRARYNLCFADFSQSSDFANKKGTVINFNDESIKLTKYLRNAISEKIGGKCTNLFAEGNRYYDLKKTYIGFHGDTERNLVLCVRLGSSFPIYFQWYHKNKEISEPVKIDVKGGDIYIMSEKAVGTDWKCSSKYTLRHAAALNEKLIFKKKED
jgi:hypothetical protein